MRERWTLGAVIVTGAITAGSALHAQSSDQDQRSRITVTGCLQQSGSPSGSVGTSGSTGGNSSAAGRTSVGDSGGSFVLVNAKMGSSPGGGSAVTTPAPPGSGTTEPAVQAGTTQPSPALTGAGRPDGSGQTARTTYLLRGRTPELSQHAGREVEISGRLAASPSGSGTSTPGSSGSPAQGAQAAAQGTASGARGGDTGGSASGSSAASQTIEVGSIRMIASACVAP